MKKLFIIFAIALFIFPNFSNAETYTNSFQPTLKDNNLFANGLVFENNFTTARAKTPCSSFSGLYTNTLQYFYYYYDAGGGVSSLTRVYYAFDLSAIPPTAIIASSSLQLTTSSAGGATVDLPLGIVSTTLQNNLPITTNNVCDQTKYGTTILASTTVASAICRSTNTSYPLINFNSNGLNYLQSFFGSTTKAGLGLMEQNAINNSSTNYATANGNSICTINQGNFSAIYNKPLLTITYNLTTSINNVSTTTQIYVNATPNNLTNVFLGTSTLLTFATSTSGSINMTTPTTTQSTSTDIGKIISYNDGVYTYYQIPFILFIFMAIVIFFCVSATALLIYFRKK